MPFRNDPLILVAHDCLWTLYKDGSFNLVIVCVLCDSGNELQAMFKSTHTITTWLNRPSLHAVYKQPNTNEIKLNCLNDIHRWSLDGTSAVAYLFQHVGVNGWALLVFPAVLGELVDKYLCLILKPAIFAHRFLYKLSVTGSYVEVGGVCCKNVNVDLVWFRTLVVRLLTLIMWKMGLEDYSFSGSTQRSATIGWFKSHNTTSFLREITCIKMNPKMMF